MGNVYESVTKVTLFRKPLRNSKKNKRMGASAHPLAVNNHLFRLCKACVLTQLLEVRFLH